MKHFVKEFKEFIATGDMIQLAVAVILGAALGALIKAFVDGIMMQIVAAVIGKPDFESLTVGIGKAELQIGLVINAAITFVATGFVLFLIIKAYNRFKKTEEAEETGPTELELLTQIRDALVGSGGRRTD